MTIDPDVAMGEHVVIESCCGDHIRKAGPDEGYSDYHGRVIEKNYESGTAIVGVSHEHPDQNIECVLGKHVCAKI